MLCRIFLVFMFVVSGGNLFLPGLSLAGTVDLPRTGQTTSYAAGDDGNIQAGVAWPYLDLRIMEMAL